MAELSTKIARFVRFLVISLVVARGLYSWVFIPPVLPPALLTPATSAIAYPALPTVVNDHVRLVTVDPALLKQGQFSLTLFDGTTYIALLDRVEEQRNGVFAWIGHLQGKRGSQVKVTVQDHVVSGVIQLDNGHYALQPLPNNLYALYEQRMTT